MSAPTEPLAPYAHLHTNPAGPGDDRPIALQIVKDEGLINAWGEKVVLVTGASAGIGLETARALHATGATIYLGVRSVSKGEATKASIEADSPGHGAIHILELALDNLASVRKAAAAFLDQSQRLDVLVNNAGVTGTTFEKTVDGFEFQFGINHLGHFLLTSLLLPALKATARPGNAARVINVASAAHNLYCDGQIDLTDLDWSRRGYDGMKAYGASKTANILHANHLDRLYGADPAHPVHALSVHPGAIMTAMAKGSREDVQEIFKLYHSMFKSPEQGAATTVWCAVAQALEGKGGLYCEDCAEAEPAPVVDGQMRKDCGYAPWAKGDHETEVKLWELSEKLVGLR
ncbi:short-chain dehydrogenase [Macrophomina phaseolina]|uniref:Short-chain dehydrogenase n=1 Tax=Macrophomina phaseolina TaxID=35725 RepID=A0ABQ8GHB7_9PEZI|nr:short-chain dehydrogenase [Macrophomina phaseolina]